MSVEEENKAVVRRYCEDVWNRGDLAAIEECFAPQVDLEGRNLGWDWWRDAVTRWRRGFPDCQVLVDQLVAEGDIVAMNFRFVGTHQGLFHWANYGPWAATGKAVSVKEMNFFRFADGRVVQLWTAWDPAAIVRQLGVLG